MTRRTLCILLSFSAVLLLTWRVGRPRSRASVPTVELSPVPEGSDNARLLRERAHLGPTEAAILLLRPGQRALAGAEAFALTGVPFCVTRDTGTALDHPLVFVPADDHSIRPSAAELAALEGFVRGGGTLILQAPADLLPSLTGVSGQKPGRRRRRLAFRTLADEGFRYLDTPEEAAILLASHKTSRGIWTHGLLTSARADAIADFPDESQPAILRRRIGAGTVYTLGFDLKDLVLRPRARRHFDAARAASNAFEPAGDVLPLILRSWYERAAPRGARLRSLPGTAEGLLLLSHDVGWGASLDGVQSLSDVEKTRPLQATWFIQTKYSKSVLPGPAYDLSLIRLIKRLHAAGHEIGSHTVSHAPDLAALPFGTGREQRRDYLPELDRTGRTNGGSLMGEVQVSKDLLEAAVGSIQGFRSAFLSSADAVDEALLRAGYRYDSSLTAPSVMTHFPFRLPLRRSLDFLSPIIEFPMSWEDENTPMDPVDARKVLDLLGKVSANEGMFVWLIHPNAMPGKRAALRAVLRGLPKGTEVWTLGRAAAFWSARESTRFSVESASAKERLLRVESPAGAWDLSFEFQSPVRSCSAGPGAQVRCAGRRVVLERSPGGPTDIRVSLK
ncbi:MAG: hypothetical protein A2X36_15010 [Elusimicrobia bacterium GWA2_69_24]|nr:MAG: hypothetical protein A2X36_15010 [Elusimicrobia bacterium GWA2_69_24]HBL18959.1 hypothetical protein [Elusimicrobiota bacterium]